MLLDKKIYQEVALKFRKKKPKTVYNFFKGVCKLSNDSN